MAMLRIMIIWYSCFSLTQEVDQIHNSDSSHVTSESVDLKNLDSADYGCEIRLLILDGIDVRQTAIHLAHCSQFPKKCYQMQYM